jgi:hypothetical protein
VGVYDVCHWLRPKAGLLSHGNNIRSAHFVEQLFLLVLGNLRQIQPGFATGRRARGLLRRLKVRFDSVDSKVAEFVANCMEWARHRRCNAAAKMQLRLDLHSFLPSFAIADTPLT